MLQAEDDATESILAEKTAIEAEKQRVEALALVQQQDYQRQKAAMDKQLRDLAYNIRQKEGLIDQLAKNEQVGTPPAPTRARPKRAPGPSPSRNLNGRFSRPGT